jgi:hypothetical protein
MPARTSHVSGKLITTAAVASIACTVSTAQAQSAGASTRLIATGLGTRIINGTGSDYLRAAFDTYQNGVIGCDASAMGGRGTISTLAVANANFDSTPFIDECNAKANASMTDSFTVTLDEPAKGAVAGPKMMQFEVSATGTVTYEHGAFPTNSGITGQARVDYSLGYSSSQGASGSASGFMDKGVEWIFQGGQHSFPDYNRSGGIWGTVPVNIPVTPGQPCTITLTMSSQSFAIVSASGWPGSFANASADFGHTLRWMGAAQILNSDGTPFLGTVQVSSPSGFNYVNPADIDSSGTVDAADLSQLLAQWGTTDSASDINQNGLVDAADLSRLLTAWTE